MKKFNGQRCERRNLTDLLLGVGPDGKKRQNPAAKKRPKNYAANPPVRKMALGGPGKEDDTFLTGPQKSMYEYLISQGNSPQVALAITSVTQKESAGKATAVEGSYANTSNKRIRGINSRFADVFGNMSDEELDALKQDPKAFFNTVYATAAGNTEPDDGYNYRGRGLVQLTGRSNYADLSQALYGDDRLVQNPDLLLDEDVAGKAAGWFALNRGKGVGGYLEFPLDQAELTPEQAQQVLDATYAVIASGGTLPKEKAVPEQMTQKYGQYTTGMPKMQNFYQRGVVQLPRTQLAEIPDQSKIDAERAKMTNFMDMIDRNAALYDLTAETPYQPIDVMAPDATNVPMQVPDYLMQRWGGPYKKTYGGYPKMNPGGPVDPNDPQFQSWLNTTGRTFYPEYSGEALSPTEWYKYVNPHNNTQEYPSNIAVDPTLLPQAGDRYMSQQIGRMSSPGAKRMTMADAYQANTERFNTNRETQRLYEDWLSRQSGPETRGVVTTVADDGLSFMRTGAASDLTYGGYPKYNPGGFTNMNLPNTPYYKNMQATMQPGQVPDFLRQYLQTQGGMNLASSGGQALGTLLEQNAKGADDPRSKYTVQEGFGAAIKGATNPLAMSFGPFGMLAGAAIGVGKSIFNDQKERNEFLAEQEELREERTALNADSAKAFSQQANSTYNQGGVGGGYYSRYGGPLDKYYNGGPTNPPTVLPGMEQYAQYANLNPELSAAVANMPPSNDRLMNFTDAEMRRNEARQAARVDAESLAQANRVASNVVQYHMDKPLDALGMDLAVLGQFPIIGEPADLLNAGISGTRAAYNTAIGDTAKAQEQAIYAGLSAASAIPFVGNVPAIGRVAKAADTVATGVNLGKTAHHIAHGAHSLERGLIGKKSLTAANYDGYKMGGPVDYETEKSEVILAGAGDKPIAVGQGKYTRLSNNLFRGRGPSHEYGGIPTRGATQPFVDSTGMMNNSPYVFSDDKSMRFDAADILSMIS